MKNALRLLPVLVLVPALLMIPALVGSAEAFSLKRIELYFENRQKQNEVMVPRNFEGLRAYADIYYTGSGILNGYWQVDGLIIERVNRFVSSEGKVTLATPAVPDLPTFSPGYHIVKFIVTHPATSFEVPEVVYWVKGVEEPRRKVLVLLRPLDGMVIPPDSLFEWEKMASASAYLVSYIRSGDEKACFSAMTRDTSYRIAPSVLALYLCPGGEYLWSVKGYDTENNIIAESDRQRFFLQKTAKSPPP